MSGSRFVRCRWLVGVAYGFAVAIVAISTEYFFAYYSTTAEEHLGKVEFI